MSANPKHDIMHPAVIQAKAIETRSNSRLYSKETDNGEIVSSLVANLAAELAHTPKKINLRDEHMITEVAVTYVDACAKAGIIPSKIGLCRAMGISRQAVDHYMSHHSEEDSAEKLRIIFDSFAEMLNTAALTGACREITAIFLAKALYQYRDNITIETEIKQDPLGPRRTSEEILAKYASGEYELPD